MNDNKNNHLRTENSKSASDKVINMHLNGNAVTIRFSRTETTGTKDNVRDILTNAYEERYQRVLKQSHHSGTTLP